ncbi:MAG: tetratricopeptide repeat protein, partial [Verrucomicrobia bacterium]|nr:tetratricopeptide repeat protein [Verrucomicrobiota bacterium]
HQIARVWRDQYEKGLTALQRQNLDYAIPIFTQVLEKEPAFYECREALRAAQAAKFKKTGGGLFKKLLGTASSTPMLAKAQLTLRGNPLDAIQTAEQILNSDPHSGAAHKLLAEAALVADLPRTAVLSLEILRKNEPRDRAIALKLAQALGKAGQPAKAEEVLSAFAQADPSDGEIRDALKDLSAQRTMQEGGYDSLTDGQGSYRDILKNKEEAVSLEQEGRQVKAEDVADRLLGEYEARLAQEPGNLKLLRSIAELYTQKKDFDRALGYYRQIGSSEGGSDPSLERAIAETTLKQFEFALSQLDPQAADYAAKNAEIQAHKQAYQLNECQQRAEKYPNDLQIRFELGELYFQTGKVGEAIREFQKAQANPHRRIQALSYLGQCFSHRGMNDLAARTLQNAIKEKVVFDDEKKDLIYALGCVLEKMGKAAEAIEQFKQVYEVDIGYKDVAAKVDAYYAAKGS